MEDHLTFLIGGKTIVKALRSSFYESFFENQLSCFLVFCCFTFQFLCKFDSIPQT